eukprot:365028-Chlamydomonas_euryale.AAC.6
MQSFCAQSPSDVGTVITWCAHVAEAIGSRQVVPKCLCRRQGRYCAEAFIMCRPSHWCRSTWQQSYLGGCPSHNQQVMRVSSSSAVTKVAPLCKVFRYPVPSPSPQPGGVALFKDS